MLSQLKKNCPHKYISFMSPKNNPVYPNETGTRMVPVIDVDALATPP